LRSRPVPCPPLFPYTTLFRSEDIKMATDLFRPVFDETKGQDGYVSLEVNPRLAYDTEGTIAEAKRYFGELNRPNLMIKVPATKRSEEHTSELQSRENLVCRLL